LNSGPEIKELKTEYITQDFLDTLAALRPTDLTVEEARDLWNVEMTNLGRTPVYTYVAVENGKVIGTATLVIERKFIRRGGKCGHIEDVAVHPDHQKHGVGKMLVERLVSLAKFQGCYKVILDCSEELIPFYRRFGFKESERHMRLDLT
jgi:glucosamine-phosphate N-acetyltransferase